MKKFLLSFMMLFALSLMTNAQVLLQEGFENGIPSTWTTIDNDGDGYNWCAMGSVGHYGETCISSASFLSGVGALTPDNWLITPQVNLSANSTLKFYVCPQNSYFYAEHYAVLISTTGNAVSDFTDTLLEETLTAPSAANSAQNPYERKSIDLSAYTGQQVYIAFRHYNVTDQYSLNLDDVSIMLIPTTPTIIAIDTSHDFGVIAIGDLATWSTTIENYNLTQDVTAAVSSPFAVSADGSTYGQTATIPATGGTLYVKFAPTVATTSSDTLILSSAGAPAVSIAIEGRGLDCDSVTVPYLTTFTNEDIFCWQIVDANNDGVTFLSDDNEGAYYYQSNSSAADDYLISPQFDFNGGVYLALDYYAAYASLFYTAEKFQVLAVGADTIQLTEVMTVENEETETLFIDLDNLVGRYSIAVHCVSDADQYALVIESFGIFGYEDSRVVVDISSQDYGIVPLGQNKILPVKITYLGVTDNVTYNATAPFQVSLDNVNFSSQVVRTVPASNFEYDTLYVKFAPTEGGVFNDFVTVTYLSNVDSIRVKGEGVDCSEGITEFPFVYDFNTGQFPLECWTVNEETNFYLLTVGLPGDYGLGFSAPGRLVTPEIHSTNPLLFALDYASMRGIEAITSFAVGYSMNTVAEEDFTFIDTVVADNTSFSVPLETHKSIIPANAKYVAIKVTEMNNYGIDLNNDLFIDNIVLTEITDPMIVLSPDSLFFGGVQLGENKVGSVEVLTAFLTSPITVTGQAEFTVSEDGLTFGASATLPAEGGIVFIKYEPTTAGSHTGVVAMTSDTVTVEVPVKGRGYDCDAVISVPYYESFEGFVDGNIPCWDNIDADGDGFSWKLNADAHDAHTGIAYVYSESYHSNAGVLTPDNFFISPVIAIPEGGASLGWFAYASFGYRYDDYYSVLIYTEEDEEGTVVFSETLSYAGWAWREVELLDYAGSNIRFAFRHHNCTNQWTIAIDDIQVTAGVGVERHESHEVTLGIYPNPASNMININASENMQKIQVLNMAGQCVYSAQVAGNNAQVNVSNLSDGMYFVKVYTNNGNVSTKKVVVRK